MEAVAADEVLLFEGFRLDLQSGGLFRVDENGHLVAVTIGSRALQILALLVMRHGGLVSKDEIMTAVWPGVVVEDSNLPTQILALRRAIDRGRSHGSCIQTVSGAAIASSQRSTGSQLRIPQTLRLAATLRAPRSQKPHILRRSSPSGV
jgi:DNA-binding response OmpR family regulator